MQLVLAMMQLKSCSFGVKQKSLSLSPSLSLSLSLSASEIVLQILPIREIYLGFNELHYLRYVNFKNKYNQ
jgi:hypothetical protein